MESSASDRRRLVAIAGHTGDVDSARQAVSDDDPTVREVALGALERLGALDDHTLTQALRDDAVAVRRRAAEVAATHPEVDLLGALHDDDAASRRSRCVGVRRTRVEPRRDRRRDLIDLATNAAEPLVRESAVAALGAIGDVRAVDTVIVGTTDKPAVRRRAVLALAPFLADDDIGRRVDAAIDRALEDRDWQVRQAAEDLRRITDA